MFATIHSFPVNLQILYIIVFYSVGLHLASDKTTDIFRITYIITIALTPSGYRNLLYRLWRVSFGSTSHSLMSKIGPVSKPSSGQKIVNPAFLSPSIKVLKEITKHFISIDSSNTS